MKNPVNVNAILNSATEREEESYAFYSDVAKQVHEQAVKGAFQQLAKDELGHKDFIKKCMKDKNLLRTPPCGKTTRWQRPVLSAHMKPKDAIALAMKKEQRAAEFYSKLSASAVDSTYRETFKRLATMELGHKAHLEAIFVDIGYPEVW